FVNHNKLTKRYNLKKMSFNPTWLIPVWGPTKDHILTKLNIELPFEEEIKTGNNERYNMKINRSSPTTIYIGKILEIQPTKSKPLGYYPLCYGIANYEEDGSGLEKAYACRTSASFIKIDINNL
ncbi:unnamed protein product, partial [marine sediment metagenome]